MSPLALVGNVIAQAASQEQSASEQMQEALVLGMARSAAIPYGQVLSNEEMDHVVNALFQCADVNMTPDGKRIQYVVQQREIEQMLG